MTWQDYMRAGIADLIGCHGVALLPGWQNSRGASLEVSIANALDLPAADVADWLAS